jgi:organic radical activating enzyme
MEIFHSIQGEGLRIGVPSVFARFPGCNLRCSWCDTKYAWEAEPVYSFYDLETLLDDTGITEIVFTGGEPLLNQDEILCFLESYTGLHITIETNGTIRPDEKLANNSNILWSVSPKLFLENWKQNISYFDSLKNVQFKFVISDVDNDLYKVSTLKLDHSIIVQPDGNKEPYSEACRELAEAVLFFNLPFRVLPQFHKICWQNRRNI